MSDALRTVHAYVSMSYKCLGRTVVLDSRGRSRGQAYFATYQAERSPIR